MQAFVIPSIFTAIDRFSTPVKNMGTSLQGLSVHAAESERALNSLTGLMHSRVGDLVLMSAKMAAVAAIFAGIVFTGKGVADYATEISNLSAVTGATGKDLEVFKSEIRSVADETKRSMVFVAQAFTAVDNNMPELHKNAEALAEVTKQSIILAKASRIELQPAAEYLSMSMNQFGMTYREAAGAVDAMAAGAVYGSSRMAETAEALQVFGATAKNVAHMTFAESVALVELGSKFEKGSEAGTRFNRILVDLVAIKPGSELSRHLQQYGVDVSKVSNRALPFFDRIKEMSKIKGSPVLMQEVFGKRGIAMAAGLFSRIDDYQMILSNLTTKGFAEQMANTNVNNLTGALQQLRDKWMNVFITSDQVNSTMNMLKVTIQFLTNHLEGIVTVGSLVVNTFIAWKGYILLTRTALIAYNFVAGIATVITGKYATSCFASIAGMNGMVVASFFLERSLLELSLMTGGVLLAVGLLTFALTDNYDANIKANGAVDNLKDGFAQVKKPIKEAQIALEKYNAAVADYDEVQAFKAHRDYEYRRGFFFGLAFSTINAVRHPSLSHGANLSDMGGYNVPVKSDYFLNPADTGLFTSPAINPMLDTTRYGNGTDKGHASAGGTQRIELHINNNSGHEIDIDHDGAPAIKITSTTNSWEGKDKWT